MHVSGADGFKTAQLAVVKNKSVFIRELLKHIDMKELAVEEPFILFIARERSAEMMEVVLSLNPDVFVQGRDQSTILHAMADNHADFQQIISDVIKKGSLGLMQELTALSHCIFFFLIRSQYRKNYLI
jgi:hypothetical protein